MTEEEKKIVDAIWGRDAEDLDPLALKQVVQGIFAMSDIVKEKVREGKIIADVSDTLH